MFFHILINFFAGFYIFIIFFCRLVNSFAEEQAIEDAIYYLGEALRKSVIESDVFLKVKIN